MANLDRTPDEINIEPLEEVLDNSKDTNKKNISENSLDERLKFAIETFKNEKLPIMFLDKNLLIVYYSALVLKLFSGITDKGYVSFTEFFGRAFKAEKMRDFYKAIHDKEENFTWVGTITHKTRSSATIFTRMTALPLQIIDDNPIGYMILLEDITQERKSLLEMTYSSILEASKLKDNETGRHNERVNYYTKCLTKYLYSTGKYPQIDADFINDIGFLAAMHDVGKIGTPDDILKKKGPLTEWEWSIMREHTKNGTYILSTYPNPMAKEIALSHHEHWDGTGYPYNLVGQMIPLAARIVAIADVYDALRMKRNYKPGFSHEETYQNIVSGSGTHFDPNLIEAFKAVNKDFNKIWEKFGENETQEEEKNL